MQDLSKFKHYQTNNNIDLYICSNNKFKTNLLQLYIMLPLKKETVSKTALIPYIMYRGSKKYPTSRDIKIKLDKLYGANLNLAVIKRGEIQFVKFSLEVINENFLPDKEPLLGKAIILLNEILTNPLFKEEYVEQEKKHIISEIKSLINDKYRYSIQRLYQEMCKDEPYSIFKLGNIDECQDINKDQLYHHYHNLLNNSHIKIFTVGDIDEEEVYQKINSTFTFEHEQLQNYNKTIIKTVQDEVNEVTEKMEVNQGKLVMGYRTAINKNHPLYYPLLVYNGILGGFTHSKLFKNVREKASLAYYVKSSIESTKGLMTISSGIESKNYKKTREIINKQVKKMKEGDFSEEEFDWTIKALSNRYKSSLDNMKGLTGHYLLGLINNKPETIEQSLKNIKKVSKKQIVETAANIKLDTVYFLDKKVEN